MAELAFDDKRARLIYGCAKLAEFVERTTVQKLMELYKDKNFKTYCLDIYNTHLNKKAYQQSQALQTKQSIIGHEIQDPSKTYPQILIGKLNVEKQTDALEVEIDNVFIPLQAIKVLTRSGRKQSQSESHVYERDINDYTSTHFKTQTETLNYDWNKTLEKSFTYSNTQLQQSYMCETQLVKDKRQSVQADIEIYQTYFRNSAIQASVYLVYGSRNLSKCLFTQFVSASTLEIRGQSQIGISASFHQNVILPLRYMNIPPGTKLAVTLWLVDPFKLEAQGQKEDVAIFKKLTEQEVDCILLEHLSPKLQAALSKITINPKDQQKRIFYSKFGYAPLGAVLHDIYDVNQVLRGGKHTLKLWPEISSYWLSSLSILSNNDTDSDSIEVKIKVQAPSLFQKQIFDKDAIQAIQNKVRAVN